MSRVCQVTGKRPRAGTSVSFSGKRGARRFVPNVQRKRFYLHNERRWVTLTVSASGIRTINKRGIESVVADLRRAGVRV